MSKFSAVLCLFLSCSLALFSQQPGSVRGVVTDESGALVPGARVTVSNATGPVKAATAGNDGSYSITGLPPGQYLVRANSPGLVQFQPASLDIQAGAQPVTLNLQLRVTLEKQEV